MTTDGTVEGRLRDRLKSRIAQFFDVNREGGGANLGSRQQYAWMRGLAAGRAAS